METEDLIAELKAQVSDLTRQNEKAKNQATYLQHVINTLQFKRGTPYDHVQSRVNSGVYSHALCLES